MKARRRIRRRYRSSDPAEYVVERISDYEEELEEYEHRDVDDADAPTVPPSRPRFKFEEVAACAQSCIRALDPRGYYVLSKAIGFVDEETAELFAPLQKKIAALRAAAVEVDRETLNLRAAMIEQEIARRHQA